MPRRKLPLLLLAAALTAPLHGEAQTVVVLKSTKGTLPDSTAEFPAGPGSDVASANCTVCHSVGMVMNQPSMSKAAWEAEVNKMRNVYKAPVPEVNVAAITEYLASIKGPK